MGQPQPPLVGARGWYLGEVEVAVSPATENGPLTHFTVMAASLQPRDPEVATAMAAIEALRWGGLHPLLLGISHRCSPSPWHGRRAHPNRRVAPRTTHHSLLTTHHSPLTTHHSPPTTHHSPLTTHHSPPTTHHSPLTTHYVPLTTYYSPLTTQHSPSTLQDNSDVALAYQDLIKRFLGEECGAC